MLYVVHFCLYRRHARKRSRPHFRQVPGRATVHPGMTFRRPDRCRNSIIPPCSTETERGGADPPTSAIVEQAMVRPVPAFVEHDERAAITRRAPARHDHRMNGCNIHPESMVLLRANLTGNRSLASAASIEVIRRVRRESDLPSVSNAGHALCSIFLDNTSIHDGPAINAARLPVALAGAIPRQGLGRSTAPARSRHTRRVCRSARPPV